MLKKKITTLGIITASIVMMAGCGSKLSVPESQIPSDLATFLYNNTPSDGIDQTVDLEVVKTEAGKEVKNDDGSVTIPINASISDKSYYNGQFEMTYEKEDKDTWILSDVTYVDRDSWEITPIHTISEDVIKEILLERQAISYAGDRIELTEDDISEIVINSQEEDSAGAMVINTSFDVSTEYVIYHTTARLTVIQDLNGYHATGAVIEDYKCELTENYTFNISDKELIKMISDKALLVGEQSVALEDVTKITERKDTFNEKDLSMTIVASVNIEKDAYDATADIYYTYKISEDGKYWQMDSYHGTNFKVTSWNDLTGLYMGYVGGDAVTMEIFESKDNVIYAVLMSDTASSERELMGTINEKDMSVVFVDPDSENELLTGNFSADLKAFTGDYGKKSKWALISQSTYRSVVSGETESEVENAKG